MRKSSKSPGEKIVNDIKRATRKQYSGEEKIRIVLNGLRGEDSIAELCRREARRLHHSKYPLARIVCRMPKSNLRATTRLVDLLFA